MKETDVLEPTDFYGVSKAAATMFCQYSSKLNNLPITTLRFFAVYGPYEEPTRLIPTVIRDCLLGRDPRLLSPFSVRDFIFIEDVVNALLKATSVGKKSYGQIYNVGYGKQYSIPDVVSMIIRLTGAKVRPLWGRAQKREKAEPKCWVSNISKIKECLGWQPRHDLEEGLKETIHWFKKNLNLYEHGAKINRTDDYDHIQQ
jgi:nucleoside-diphosphate-sugar epimerase